MSDPNQEGLVCQLEEDSRIVLVGLGGIGAALLPPLSLFLDSLQIPLRLTLVDGDDYLPHDKARQAFSGLGNKAQIKAAETLQLLGDDGLTVVSVAEYLKPDNLESTIFSGDWLLLCVDNHESRRLVSDYCRTLDDIVLISGGNEGFDPPQERGTYGSVQVVIRRDGKDVTVPLDHYHPEIAAAKGELPHEAGCGQLIQSVPQLVFANFAVASAMANAFLATACGRLTYQEVKLDILEVRMLPQFQLPTVTLG